MNAIEKIKQAIKMAEHFDPTNTAYEELLQFLSGMVLVPRVLPQQVHNAASACLNNIHHRHPKIKPSYGVQVDLVWEQILNTIEAPQQPSITTEGE